MWSYVMRHEVSFAITKGISCFLFGDITQSFRRHYGVISATFWQQETYGFSEWVYMSSIFVWLYGTQCTSSCCGGNYFTLFVRYLPLPCLKIFVWRETYVKLPGYCIILRGPREPWSAVARFQTECLRLAPISGYTSRGRKIVRQQTLRVSSY